MPAGPPYFDDNGRPVPGIDPRNDEQPAVDDREKERQQDLLRTLQWLSSGRVGALAIGRRVLLISYALRPQGSQGELAKRLKLTPGRVSRAIKGVKTLLRYLSDESESESLSVEKGVNTPGWYEPS